MATKLLLAVIMLLLLGCDPVSVKRDYVEIPEPNFIDKIPDIASKNGWAKDRDCFYTKKCFSKKECRNVNFEIDVENPKVLQIVSVEMGFKQEVANKCANEFSDMLKKDTNYKNGKQCSDQSKIVKVYRSSDGPYLNGEYDIYCSEDELMQSRKSLMLRGNK